MLVFLYIVLVYVAACLFLVSTPIIKKQFRRRFSTINQIAFVKSPNNKRNIKRMKIVKILIDSIYNDVCILWSNIFISGEYIYHHFCTNSVIMYGCN